MKCIHCNKEYSDYLNKCPYCGVSARASKGLEKADIPTFKMGWYTALIRAVLFVFAGLLVLWAVCYLTGTLYFTADFTSSANIVYKQFEYLKLVDIIIGCVLLVGVVGTMLTWLCLFLRLRCARLVLCITFLTMGAVFMAHPVVMILVLWEKLFVIAALSFVLSILLAVLCFVFVLITDKYLKNRAVLFVK